MNRFRTFFLVAPAFMLIAAEAPPISRNDPGFGLVVDTNIVAHVVDMSPEYAGVPMEGSNGQRSVDAYRRYQSGNVKKLYKQTGESTVGGQGGSVEQIITAPQQGN